MEWASRTENHGNAGETAGSFFHRSGPSEFGYVIQRKSLILQPELARGADRTPFHPVNPGSMRSRRARVSVFIPCGYQRSHQNHSGWTTRNFLASLGGILPTTSPSFIHAGL